MRDELRRDTIGAVFAGVNRDDYEFVSRQLESYGATLEALAYREGFSLGERKANNYLVVGLLAGSLVGGFVSWGLTALFG